MQRSDLRELVAAGEHDQWSHWTSYLFGVLKPFIDLDSFSSLEQKEEAREAIERWRGQMTTPYAFLSESEKDSDRVWADKVLELFPLTYHDMDHAVRRELGDTVEPWSMGELTQWHQHGYEGWQLRLSDGRLFMFIGHTDTRGGPRYTPGLSEVTNPLEAMQVIYRSVCEKHIYSRK